MDMKVRVHCHHAVVNNKFENYIGNPDLIPKAFGQSVGQLFET